jgi:hypothetical protein
MWSVINDDPKSSMLIKNNHHMFSSAFLLFLYDITINFQLNSLSFGACRILCYASEVSTMSMAHTVNNQDASAGSNWSYENAQV